MKLRIMSAVCSAASFAMLVLAFGASIKFGR